MSVIAPVQAQLDAYNAHDLEKFLAQYHEDIMVIRFPSMRVSISGKKALREFYRDQRFCLPDLKAIVTKRIVHGNKVIDHEQIFGLQPEMVEAVAIYLVEDLLIRTIWFVD